MSEDIRHHSGSKYIRRMVCIDGDRCTCPQGQCFVDVYDVVEAFKVEEMPVSHAVKKLLCAGIRGKGDKLQDFREARDALTRAIQQEERRIKDSGQLRTDTGGDNNRS